MTTGELNRRITVRRWTSNRDAGGGLSPSQVQTWELWAKIENRSGGSSNPNNQRVWSYDASITVRYDRAKPILSNDTIDYDGIRYEVKELVIDKEGRRDWAKLSCSMVDKNIGSELTTEIIDISTGVISGLWRGKLSQSGTGDPTVILRNQSLGVITWARQSQGRYIGTSAGLFTAGKTDVIVTPNTNNTNDAATVQGSWIDVNTVLVHSYDLGANDVDGELSNTIVEIRRYI